MRLALPAVFLLAACGDDSSGGPDAQTVSCDEYCTQVEGNCSGAQSQYTSRDQCLAVCAAFEQGSPGAMNGNSLECRAYHAGAALGDPDTHCVHAGPSGGQVCGSLCEGFCSVVQFGCTEGN